MMAPPMRFSFVIVSLVLLSQCSGRPEAVNDEPPTYVGREACAGCHAAETELWEGSYHDLAMQPASASTVLGDFDEATFDYAGVTSTFFERDGSYFVRTDGPDGELTEYEVAYTFGVEPLQQYLVPFEARSVPGTEYRVGLATHKRWRGAVVSSLSRRTNRP